MTSAQVLPSRFGEGLEQRLNQRYGRGEPDGEPEFDERNGAAVLERLLSHRSVRRYLQKSSSPERSSS